MKKIFFNTMMMALLLTISTNAAWGQQLKVYFAALKAQTSETSTGSGQVKLTWVDITGKPLEVPLAKELNWAAYSPSASWDGMAAYSSLQTIEQIDNGEDVEGAKAYDGPGATAQVIGGTMCAMDGIETATPMANQIYMTSYVYYHAEAVPAPGSYLAGWTFTDPAVSRIDTAMGNGEDIDFISPCFKVLPDTTNNAPFVEETEMPFTYTIGLFAKAQEVATTASKVNNIYAVFNKYLLSNPQATSGHMNAGTGNTATLDVSIDVEGDITQFKDNYADFVFPSFSGQNFYEDDYGTWSWNLARLPYVVGATKMRADVIVTFTAKTADTGTRNATITIRMAHTDPSKASTLNIPLTVDVRPAATDQATLYDGKTPTANSGDLEDMIAAADGTDYTVVLNDKYTEALNINATVTIDLNGYNINNAITVSGGDVTFAYSKFGGSASSLTVNGGKAILDGGEFGSLTIGTNGTVEQNGATITGTAINNGTLTTTNGTFNGGLTSTQTLNVNGGTFNGTNAIEVSGGTANINKGTLNGTSLGLLVSGGTATTQKLAVINSENYYSAQRTAGTLNIESGKFNKPINGTINFTAGYFKNNSYGVSTEGKTEMVVAAGVEYNEGYRYFLGTTETALANGVGVCRIGTTSYAKLEDAIAYANNNPNEELVIFMTNDYTLPAGYYTLPAKATLVVPMSDTQSKEINKKAPRVVYNDARKGTPYVEPTEFRRLTFAAGVNMEVFGHIELTCSQFASNEAYTAQPYGPYGHLVLEEGSHMTLQNGSEVRAWGFITGKGETDARRGSKVREMFQLGDWKGAFTSVKIVGMAGHDPTLKNIVGDESGKKIFPVTQYFIQNIESPVKYHPGAVLSTSAAVSEGLGTEMSISMAATDIAIVGVNGQDSAIFVMDANADAENTWVRKWYDAENDIQTYDINSGAHIGQMVLDMGELNMAWGNYTFSVPVRLNSAKFDLPLTSNFKIHLLSGTLDFKQNTCLLPGAEVEVDKESTVSVAMDEDEKKAYDAWVDGGKEGDVPVSYTGALYVYDADDWNNYAFGTDENGQAYAASTKTVRYAPSWNGRPTKRNEMTKVDAKINVHGTFTTATGFVYTSVGNGKNGIYYPEGEPTGGANIFSSNEDAGTFIFNENASEAENPRKVYQVRTGNGSFLGRNTDFDSIPFYPARLKNGNGSYVNTDEAVADLAYCYQNYEWSTMVRDEDDNCFMKENRGGNDVYYAKPAEYVAVVATKVTYNEGTDDEYKKIIGNDDHTFSDAAGAGRLFILMDDCQWWEVEQKDNLYHCIHPNNDTYYYWGKINNEDPDEDPAWHEQKFTITWKNWNGDVITTHGGQEGGANVTSYKVTYGTQAEFLGTNPTREADIDYTYDFTGWNPEPGRVTADVTYTATYEQKPRMYTIIFQNQGGTEIERQFLEHNAVPVCENTPSEVGKILVWSPAISPVIADATYTATWIDEPPTEWDITFVNNAGGVLQATAKVNVNDRPVYNGSTPAKENADHTAYSSNEYTYTFWGWSAVIDGETQTFADGVTLPFPTDNTTYTAVYTQGYQTYDVTFKNENGDEIETNSYRYGETPVCSATPTEPNNPEEGYTYSFAWTPQIQTVQGPATYTATFTGVKNKYTVTLLSSIESACALTGAGIYEYGDDATLNATASSGYTFQRWNDGNTDNPRTVNVTDNLTYMAVMQSVAPIENETIAAGMTYDVPENTRVNNLIICSNGTSSGSIINAQNLKVDGNAYFDLTLNAEAGKWYAVAVPWQVSVANGIYLNGAKKTLNRDYYFVQYNGAIRAAQGTVDDCWQFVNSGNLQPGTFYMIYLRNAATTIRFAKAAYTPIINRQITVQMYPQATGDEKDANWNGIANPAVFHANMEGLGVTSTDENKKAQVFDKSTESLTTVLLSEHTFQVGEPVFIQAETAKSMVLSPETPAPAPARRMAPALESNSEYDIRIAQEDKPYTDRLFISTAKEKADKYVIGQDLAKMGTSAIAAQLWVNRYNAKLCVNRTEMQDNQAVFPLCIFAPKAGEYQISSATPAIEGEEIYVTINGNPVWNLAAGAYTAILPAGNSTQYALLVTHQNAPAMPTDIEETITENDAVRKVLIGGQVYILRDGAVYTITGQKLQ